MSKSRAEKELEDLGNRIQDFQQTAQESIQKKKEELYGPILKKAEAAIKDIAKEKGYSYIFDTSLGTVLYAQDSDNIPPAFHAGWLSPGNRAAHSDAQSYQHQPFHFLIHSPVRASG